MIRNSEEKVKVVQSLAKEVFSECTAENVPVSFNLCAYLMDLSVIQLSGDFSLENYPKFLVKACVSYLKEEPLFMKTIKMQINWQEKYQSRDEIKKLHHERIFGNVLPIMSEITDISLVDREYFYKKVVIFVIMFAGLGSPTQQLIIKETQDDFRTSSQLIEYFNVDSRRRVIKQNHNAALLSIFKASEVDNFVNLPKATKEQQLVEFARLITGIILFNKDCKKGGEGMDDLPLILTQGVRATKERLVSFKDQLVKRIDHLVKGLSQGHRLKDESVEAKISETLENRNENLKKLKTLLIYYNQLKYFTNDLVRDLEKSFVVIEELVERLQGTLLHLHNVVRYRVAVATVQVFPLFVHLSDIWVEMQEEVDILSEINNSFMDLSFAAKLTLPTPMEFEFPSVETVLPENDSIQSSSEFYPGVRVCSFLSLSGQEHLQYEGFCAYTLAHEESLLVPGNVTIGVLQFSNRFYTFSSPEAAHKWALDPIRFLKTVLNLTKTNPELIRFLNLYSDLENNFFDNMKVREEEEQTKANASVQTELHPVESYINKNYTFSDWELKKRAIKLAALTRCVTRSQQTMKRGCFRSEVAVQVTPHKDISTQTTRDGYCNPLSLRAAWKLTTGSRKL